LKLANERDLLAAIRQRLHRNRETSPLFDTGRLSRHIESAYVTMLEMLRRGEPPRGFAVDPT
jgi:protein O-GlcNAc transferase